MDSTKSFPRLDVLPHAQQVVWAELNQIPTEFTLYGGTAIALYLGHRESVDFDFFGTEKFAPLDLLASLSLLSGARVTQSEPNTLSVIIYRDDAPVKMSFFGLPHIEPLRTATMCADNGLKVASLLDLAGMKAAVVQNRAEPKDYIDIDAILSETDIDLALAIGAARAIYGSSFSITGSLKALGYFGEPRLEALPSALKSRLSTAVQSVIGRAIPEVQALGNTP